MLTLPAVFVHYQAEIEAEIRSVLDERQSPLYDMMRYHFGWMDEKGIAQHTTNGKAVRPTLCLVAYRALDPSGDYKSALPAAAAVELVHNYSLIHDDIQDDDRERRHRPTVWSVWGKPQAINAGTAMRLLANIALRRLNVPFAKETRLQSLVDEATISLIEGQYLDISFENRFDITVSDYCEMIGGKTGALFACSLQVGAELGCDADASVNAFREFGWNLGMAFQVRDDILGIWGRQEETGKPSCNDIRRRKKTLPVVHALEQATPSQRNELTSCYRSRSFEEDKVHRVLEVLESAGSLDAARRMTSSYIDRANEALEHLSLDSDSKRDIDEVVDFLGTRRF